MPRRGLEGGVAVANTTVKHWVGLDRRLRRIPLGRVEEQGHSLLQPAFVPAWLPVLVVTKISLVVLLTEF